jgi:hypothetical protein
MEEGAPGKQDRQLPRRAFELRWQVLDSSEHEEGVRNASTGWLTPRRT